MPWIDFAVEQTTADEEDEAKKEIADQVHVGADVLKTLRVVTSESYVEDGALVSHSLLEIQDVKK